MSAIENNSEADHLPSKAACMNSHYRADTGNQLSLPPSSASLPAPPEATASLALTMGGMVSALTAVLCGTVKQQDAEDICSETLLPNSNRPPGDIAVERRGRKASGARLSKNSEHKTPERSDYSRPVTLVDEDEYLNEPCSLRYMDEDSDTSQLSHTETELRVERDSRIDRILGHGTTSPHRRTMERCITVTRPDKHTFIKQNSLLETGTLNSMVNGGTLEASEQDIEISEGEYSADEDQPEEEDENLSSDEFERIDSEPEGKFITILSYIQIRQPALACHITQPESHRDVLICPAFLLC